MIPNKPLEFGEWRPDIALLDNKFATIAENVYAGINSYEPFPGLAAITDEQLPDTCVGLTFARQIGGGFVLFAGTRTKLYKWTGLAWADMSGAATYAVPAGDRWTWAQFGTKLIAVQMGNAPVVIDVDVGTSFAPLAGTPPTASAVTVIGDFVVLSGLLTNKRIIQWSSINNIEEWIPGTNLGDMQEFPDGGPVQGVAGSEVGFVVQDRNIRTMQFLPGDTTVIFTFSRVERERGGAGKYDFIFTRGSLFFRAEDGFFAVGAPDPAIGNDAVNHWFLKNSDPGRREQTLVFSDVTHTRVMWAFYNNANSQLYDRILIYDWHLNRWTYSTEAAQMWATLAAPGVNLDVDVPGVPADVFLDSNEPGLDSTLYTGGQPVIGGIDANGRLGILDGPNLPAIIETAEAHLSVNKRTFVSSAYPVIDAAPVTVTIGERERLQDTPTWGVPVPVEVTGAAAVFSSSRLHRFRVATPHAAVWTHAQGVAVEAQPDGEGY